MRPIIIATLIAVPSIAQAEYRSTATVILELSSIVGGAEKCGVALDDAAIRAYVARNVDPADMSFTSAFPSNLALARQTADRMTGNGLAAYCEALSRSAEANGLAVK